VIDSVAEQLLAVFEDLLRMRREPAEGVVFEDDVAVRVE
jgi:hypothetical protein